jgi:hypothetical protein
MKKMATDYPRWIIQEDSLFSAAPVSAIYLGARISDGDKELIRALQPKKCTCVSNADATVEICTYT